jgi:hypothetical protein
LCAASDANTGSSRLQLGETFTGEQNRIRPALGASSFILAGGKFNKVHGTCFDDNAQ